MVRIHQPDEAAFRSILPEDIDWKPFPAFPPAVRLAVLVGHPAEPGPYMIRVKAPRGVKLMPHRHPEDSIYTVMFGFSTLGWANISTATSWHFHRAKSGEYVTQIPAIGPLGLEYMNPTDDPRQRHVAAT